MRLARHNLNPHPLGWQKYTNCLEATWKDTPDNITIYLRSTFPSDHIPERDSDMVKFYFQFSDDTGLLIASHVFRLPAAEKFINGMNDILDEVVPEISDIEPKFNGKVTVKAIDDGKFRFLCWEDDSPYASHYFATMSGEDLREITDILTEMVDRVKEELHFS